MKSKYYIIGGASLVVVAIVVLSLLNINNAQAYASTKTAEISGNNLGNSGSQNSEIQEVRLYMKDFNYATEPAVLKKGIPVRMTADLKTVVGCARDVVIKEFDVRKYVTQGDNIIEFIPTKTGTIAIACSMNMFHGTFQVIDESNPNAGAEVTATPINSVKSTSPNSCGMANGGGCGCGGMKNI